ncbi:7126_t:CDS:1 [Paraglomus occultum]|uniref:7126_t:CDS:1 n=1 Tax=Paraglomus occultum TaxID=144539 RepID=A0A9N9FHW8_9GLOM|nr:7126_t:CDS:1 [Paraglomus occultum]
MQKFFCFRRKAKSKSKAKDAEGKSDSKTTQITTATTTATLVTSALISDLEKQNLPEISSKRYIDGDESENSTAVVSSSLIPDLEKLNLPEERLKRYMNEVKEKESHADTELELRKKAVALRENAISKTLNKIKRSMEVDLCFVLDCTGSMHGHIAAAKDCILQVVNYVKSTNPSIKICVGFCGYRDHCDGNKRLQLLDFTSSCEKFRSYLSRVPATGGGDTPEDVLGGLNAAITKLSWRNGTRILLHIGDSPPHGRRYHTADDCYPDGDPNGLTAESVLKEMQMENILYFFGKVTNDTNTMVEVFRSIIGEFSVFDLIGGDPTTLIDRLYKAACSAITSSVTLTSTIGSDIKSVYSMRQKKLEMNTNEPDWEESKSHSGVLLWYRTPKTVGELKNHGYFNKSNLFSQSFSFKMSMEPFSAGAERYAYFGVDTKSEPNRKVVIKEYLSLKQHTNLIEKYLEAVEVSTVAHYLSVKFNLAIKRMDVKKVNFLEVKLLRSTIDFKTQYYTVEPRLQDAEFKRFNVNSGVIVELRPSLEAFAHFTYEYTNKYLVVYDLQGMELSDEFLLTDPAIHCIDPLRFGKTNLGVKGISNCFLANHKCNDICKKLGLGR